MDVARIMKSIRKKNNFTQKELAKELGVSESLISRYESNDVKNMGIDKLIPLAKVLKCTPAYLMGWEENKKTSESNIDMNCVYEETEFMRIPLYRSISAGYGSCESEFVEFIAVPGLKPNGTTYFAIKVKGDSMEPKIPNGATIIIKKDIQIENGEIGAFCHNEDNVVKQKKNFKDRIILHSFNLAVEDRVVYEYDDYKEYGKVVKVMIDL